MAAGPLADPLGSAPVGLLKGLRIQLGTVEVGVAQVGSVKATAPQVGAAQGGSPQVGVAEVAVAQVRPIEPGLSEVGALQLGSPEGPRRSTRMHEVHITRWQWGQCRCCSNTQGVGPCRHAAARLSSSQSINRRRAGMGVGDAGESPLGCIGSRDGRRPAPWRQPRSRDGRRWVVAGRPSCWMPVPRWSPGPPRWHGHGPHGVTIPTATRCSLRQAIADLHGLEPSLRAARQWSG